uniref:Uncharacterized protein n=1 Tax=Candidatus Kentrum sp. LPFa TaxID=2126335 RepID=A0A450Y401_9GAMM|nr:MAG: hypothetical protein BECKLPF1236C_GA0070990_105631 [Candidatus Kentron sp. LPFa]
MISRFITSLANSARDQWLIYSGGVSQATAIIRHNCSGENFPGLPERALSDNTSSITARNFLRLAANPSNLTPPSTHLLLQRPTVSSHKPIYFISRSASQMSHSFNGSLTGAGSWSIGPRRSLARGCRKRSVYIKTGILCLSIPGYSRNSLFQYQMIL